MPTVVHLVRHGEVDNPDHLVYADLGGFELSATGREQAASAAEFLSTKRIAGVYSSPLQRAMQTAVPIARPHGLAVTSLPALTEWYLAHRWKGVPWERLDEAFPGELQAYLENPLDLPFSPESVRELAGRMTAAIGHLVGVHKDEEIVVVSHQDPIQAARLALLDRPLGTLNEDKPDHAEVFSLELGEPWCEVHRMRPEDPPALPPLD